MNRVRIAVLVAVLLFPAFTSIAAAETGRVWTAKEILAERKKPLIKKNQRFCNGGAFKPCVCVRDVPTLVQYRPAVKECGGRAAVVLSGSYMDIFSVVVRDYENKDRWPVSGFGSCTPYERDTLGLNKCSAFKVQKILGVEDPVRDAEVHCLGASGYSPLFRRVVRITAKFQDVPGSNEDPLARWCLSGPTRSLN